jgi:hypothetical protein
MLSAGCKASCDHLRDVPPISTAGSFSAPSVAAWQQTFCSCIGTAHFGLRRAQRRLSSAHRGRAIHKTINFRTRKPQRVNACGLFLLVASWRFLPTPNV